MRNFMVILAAFLTLTLVTGCGGPKRSALPEGVSRDIAVLPLGADTSRLNQDQITLLNQTLRWMDRDIIRALKRSGFKPVKISSEEEYTGAGNGYLLKISITDHKMIPKGARFLGGMMAGADRIGAHYELVDPSRKTVLSWDDTQGSSKGGTYCAQTLNRNAADRIVAFLSGS